MLRCLFAMTDEFEKNHASYEMVEWCQGDWAKTGERVCGRINTQVEKRIAGPA